MDSGETDREEEILPKPKVLPSEIIMFDILSRVEVKSLIQFRSVSKSWNKLVTDPFFINMHMNRSLENNSFKVKLMIRDTKHKLFSIDYEEGLNHAVAIEHPMSKYFTRVCGSCNGLLCTMFNDELYIWNPSTTKCTKVPDYVPRKGHCKYGFGYNQDIDDYEIVRISRVSEERNMVKSVVDVYSLLRNSWRTIPGPIHYIFKDVRSVFVEGSLHWLVLTDKVIAFDSGREMFREVPLPEFDTYCNSINILEFGGKLYILCNHGRKDSELWVMKVYGVKESWTKLFNIPAHLICTSLLCLKRNGSVLLNGENLDVILYDPKSKKRSFKHIKGIHGVTEATTYVESIVPVLHENE